MTSSVSSYISTLTPLQLTAGAAMLQNQGLRVNPTVPIAISSYTSLPLISTYLTVLTEANAGTGGLSTGTKHTLGNLASNTCAALSDSQPQYYLNLTTFYGVPYPPGLSGIVSRKANLYLGDGNLNKFSQIFSACESYKSLANQFIISACNANNYLCDTFTNNDNSIAGDITKINLATPAFGEDLRNMGQLWDLSNLDNLGSPLALTQRIISITGVTPALGVAFVLAGVPQEVVVNLTDPALTVTDAAQKAMYTAMTQIKGDTLSQILTIFNVTTAGIETMSDLLNPVKLFPLSFQSLTTVTANGPRAIYTNNTGSVNTELINQLPPYVVSSLV